MESGIRVKFCGKPDRNNFSEKGEAQEKETVRGGFEPPVRFYPYNGLANRRFRPLSHRTRSGQGYEGP